MCESCHMRMKIAYQFKLDCDNAAKVFEGISDSHSIPETPTKSQNTPKSLKNKTNITNLEDLFTFEFVGSDESKEINNKEADDSTDDQDNEPLMVLTPKQKTKSVRKSKKTKKEVSKRLFYPCYMCQLQFSTMRAKAIHNVEVHKKNEAIKICTLCPYSASTWSEICKHAFNHRPASVSIYVVLFYY